MLLEFAFALIQFANGVWNTLEIHWKYGAERYCWRGMQRFEPLLYACVCAGSWRGAALIL